MQTPALPTLRCSLYELYSTAGPRHCTTCPCPATLQKRFGKDAGQIIDVLELWKELQSRFGKDAGQIIDILELWEEHGKDFMVWKESPPAPKPAPPPPVEQQQPPQSAVAALAAAVPAAAVGGAAAGMLASRDVSSTADSAGAHRGRADNWARVTCRVVCSCSKVGLLAV